LSYIISNYSFFFKTGAKEKRRVKEEEILARLQRERKKKVSGRVAKTELSELK
jgi:hypothetical protein